ncbi:IS30 family transposase [sulfur-oxidizing endosymbiont of Gigantopelta aegis]|uniref:IS30 family transposase n=1 Tax=sulfur-oxidizing endosymbiont of Gigantopelta aegis TaxID=2794934 RepID=UPI0018DDE26F|nr:IS30 family transposase [sulfur-oxidizing endosymbiont of Gigantopelta aegis]
MRTYKQLTQEQRYYISTEIKNGISQSKIAQAIEVSKSTICREIKRNAGLRGYRFKQAQEKAVKRRYNASKAIKMTDDMIALIDEKLSQHQWSPEQISGWLLNDKMLLLSHERIYQHIWDDKKQGGDLHQYLRRQGKKYQKRGSNGKSSRGQIINRISIDDRPKIVDDKRRVGDWEIDTVIGKGHSGALVTIVERKTLYTLVARVNGKQVDWVTQATIQLLKPFKDRLHSITADNGKEFAYHEQVSKALDTAFYFAHPYSSWERGLNENTNGLIRQYFPKDTDFKEVTDKEVYNMMEKLNNRPRKALGFQTPFQAMKKSFARTGTSCVALQS